MMSYVNSHTKSLQLPMWSGSDVANVVASYMEPTQIPIWGDSNKITMYDAFTCALYKRIYKVCINPSITITGCDLRYGLSMDPIILHKHKCRRIKINGSRGQIQLLHDMIGAELIDISLSNFSELTTIPIFQNLRMIIFYRCQQLNKFLICCPKIRMLCVKSCEFDLDGCDLEYCSEIKCIKISDTKISNIDALFRCPYLRKIELGDTSCSILPMLSKLKLKILVVKDMKITDISYLAQHRDLRYLRLEQCSVTNIPQIAKLKKLIVKNCPIKNFAFLLGCSDLECVKLENCVIDEMSHFKACTKLKRIVLTNCILVNHYFDTNTYFLHPVIIEIHNDAYNISKLDNLFVDANYACNIHFLGGNINKIYADCTTLELSKCSVKNLDQLILWKRLTLVHLNMCCELENINGLKECPDICAITIARCPKLSNLSVLQQCPKLKLVAINSDMDALDLIPLMYCTALKVLGILYWLKLRDFMMFPICNVDTLEIMSCPTLININGLSCWANLVTLNLQCCCELRSIPVLKQIKQLIVTQCENLEDVSNLVECDELIELFVDGCNKLTSIFGSTNMKILWLEKCANLEDVRGAFQCEKLIDLHVKNCEKINVNDLLCLKRIVDNRIEQN